MDFELTFTPYLGETDKYLIVKAVNNLNRLYNDLLDAEMKKPMSVKYFPYNKNVARIKNVMCSTEYNYIAMVPVNTVIKLIDEFDADMLKAKEERIFPRHKKYDTSGEITFFGSQHIYKGRREGYYVFIPITTTPVYFNATHSYKSKVKSVTISYNSVHKFKIRILFEAHESVVNKKILHIEYNSIGNLTRKKY